jgi:hypothetical protein
MVEEMDALDKNEAFDLIEFIFGYCLLLYIIYVPTHFFTFIKSPIRIFWRLIWCRRSLFGWHVGQISLLSLDFEVVLLDNIYSVISPKFSPF